MKKRFLVVLCLMASGAWAQESRLQFTGSGLVTNGGDKLYQVTYNTGDTSDITAGGTYQFNAGASYSLSPVVDLQITVGYHTSTSNAINGSIDFTRWPVELLGFYQLNNQFRIGGGLRQSLNTKTAVSGVGSGLPTFEFKSNPGGVIELQYLLNTHQNSAMYSTINFRYVAESFTEKSTSTKINGNHIGVGLSFYR